MVYYIGNVEIPSISSVELSDSKVYDELDINEESHNFVFEEENEIAEITISFTLYPTDEFPNVEDQRDELKRIANRAKNLNDFVFNEYIGYLAVNDVSLGQSGSEDNFMQGTITALYLPWPKTLSEQSRPREEPSEGPFGRIFGRGFGGNT